MFVQKGDNCWNNALKYLEWGGIGCKVENLVFVFLVVLFIISRQKPRMRASLTGCQSTVCIYVIIKTVYVNKWYQYISKTFSK